MQNFPIIIWEEGIVLFSVLLWLFLMRCMQIRIEVDERNQWLFMRFILVGF